MSDSTRIETPATACCGELDTGSRDPFSRLAALARRLGAPVALILAVIALLAIFDPAQVAASLIFAAQALLGISPYLLASVVLAAALKASGADQLVALAFAGRAHRAILLAAGFGALSPFCSCGVVPLVASLLAAGVPLAPVMAFCLASPIMDPEMFILTAAGISLPFAVVKTGSAVAIGLMAGYATWGLQRAGLLDDVLRPIARPACGQSACTATLTPAPVIDWGFWRRAAGRRVFASEAWRSGWFLTRWLAFAFLLESVMVAYVPGDTVASWLGDGNAAALPLAVVLGIPAYLNGYAAIPLVGGLIDLGMSPATGLAFMLAGSITSIPAAIAVWTLFKPRLFAVYLMLAMLGALAAGAVYMIALAWF